MAEYDATYQTKRCCKEDALIARLLSEIPSQQTLDIACGTGHFESMLPGEVTGLDVDPDMLAHYCGKAKLFRGSFTQFPSIILARKYDLVTNLFGVFGDTQAFIAMCQNVRSVLRVGGSFFVVAYGIGRKDTGFARDILAKWGDYIPYTSDKLRDHLHWSNFDVVYSFGMSATVLDYVPGLFDFYHLMQLPDILPIKYFRAHYVVALARRRE